MSKITIDEYDEIIESSTIGKLQLEVSNKIDDDDKIDNLDESEKINKQKLADSLKRTKSN